jgi:arabinogalactan endo-1,4-beta-galactosidase
MQVKNLYKLTFILLISLFSCTSNKVNIKEVEEIIEDFSFYSGADLSYVNEMEDCGAIYKNNKNVITDPFQIFANNKANLIRVRKWHNPSWTNYSNLADIEKTIKRAKGSKMKVLLDFHYSDDWADPNKQEIPKAWLPIIDDLEVLGDSIYNYTYETLEKLDVKNLLPEMVQVGNETNIMILQKDNKINPMNWKRNAFLLNKGIKAVRDISKDKGKKIEIMLHIAQPENGLTWFKEANNNGVIDYDWIGLSYYPKWSSFNFDQTSIAIKTLIKTYNKKLMIVETSYPFTLNGVDNANNILGADSLISEYPATQEGQLNYLLDFKKLIKNAGGKGLIYWEPAWVSNNCSTRWGKGSHWENATLFDFDSNPTLGISFLNPED